MRTRFEECVDSIMAIVFLYLVYFYFVFDSYVWRHSFSQFLSQKVFNEVDYYSHVFTSFAFIRIAWKGGSVARNTEIGNIQRIIVGTGKMEWWNGRISGMPTGMSTSM